MRAFLRSLVAWVVVQTFALRGESPAPQRGALQANIDEDKQMTALSLACAVQTSASMAFRSMVPFAAAP